MDINPAAHNSVVETITEYKISVARLTTEVSGNSQWIAQFFSLDCESMDELEEFRTWLKSCSEEGGNEVLKYVLADIEELEWRAKHGYRYDQNAFLTLRRQHQFLNTRMKEIVIKDVKRMMEDHK